MNLIVEENDIQLLHVRDMDDDTPGYIISGTRLGYQSGLTPEMARLIAAAPDLLEALKRALDALARNGVAEDDQDVYESGETAINKAQGKE